MALFSVSIHTRMHTHTHTHTHTRNRNRIQIRINTHIHTCRCMHIFLMLVFNIDTQALTSNRPKYFFFTNNFFNFDVLVTAGERAGCAREKIKYEGK